MIFQAPCIIACVACAQPEPVTVARGLTGTIRFEYAGPALRAKQNQSLTNAVIVRLNKEGEGKTYRLDFIGAIAGEFDLRDTIEGVDGPLPADVPPLRATVFTQLPADHGTDLFEVARPGFDLESHYGAALWTLGALWVSVPLIVGARRLLRARPAPPPAPPPPARTLADQLRELVELAMAGGMTVAEQGRLELLLLAHWGERMSLQSLPVPEAVARLRRDPVAGGLLLAVESWLHSGRQVAPVPESRVAELLAPYLHVPELVAAQGGAR